MTALTNAGTADKATANVVSFEPDDASVVAKITSGEADAAVVYVSDVSGAAATQVNSIAIPANVNVVATYPIAVVKSTKQGTLAQSFVNYVTGAQGQATLKSFGFLLPAGSA